MISEKKELLENTRRYYEQNTRFFHLLGSDAGSGAIHQHLYLQPESTKAEAVRAQENILLRDYISLTPGRQNMLDAGCGSGSSMTYLATILGETAHFYGITLSEFQAKAARKRIENNHLGSRCQAHVGDYHRLPDALPAMDLVYAIESFVHSTDPDAFFRECRRVLKPGGKLVIFDDFLKKSDENTDGTEKEILATFRAYWKAHTLFCPEEVVHGAQRHGLKLIEERDLTCYLHLNRTRDGLVRLFLPLLKAILPRWHYTSFLTGGNARQDAYRQELLCYKMFSFKKEFDAEGTNRP